MPWKYLTEDNERACCDSSCYHYSIVPEVFAVIFDWISRWADYYTMTLVVFDSSARAESPYIISVDVGKKPFRNKKPLRQQERGLN